VFLSNTSTGQNPLIREIVTQPSWTPQKPLDISTYQFWARARVGDTYAGGWSPPVSFAVATAPTPLAPVISTVSQMPQFTCSVVPGATRYGFYLQNLVTGQVVANVSGLPQPAWTPATAIPFGAYRWWAIAETANGFRSNWSAAVDITIGDRPVLLSPRGNTGPTALAARWLPIRNAIFYEVWINQIEPAIPAIYTRTGITGTRHEFSPALARERTYRIWIRAALTQNSFTPWSVAAEFRIT
jgi:hypothetical protein